MLNYLRWRVGSRGNALLLVPSAILLTALFVYPLFQVLLSSAFDPQPTLEHYQRILERPVYLSVLWRTVEISLGVTALCFVLGYPAAYFLAHCSPRQRTYLFILVLLPLWTSILIRSYSWIVVLGKNGVLNLWLMQLGLIDSPVQMLYTTATVYVAMVQILLPVTILTCYSVMMKIDEGLVRAARVLGAGPWRAFINVYLPLSLPGVVSGAVITFILAMGFFVTPALVGGRRDLMIGNLIEAQVNQSVNIGFASTLGILLLVTTIAIVMAFRALTYRRPIHDAA